jgi:hypothetical protein
VVGFEGADLVAVKSMKKMREEQEAALAAVKSQQPDKELQWANDYKLEDGTRLRVVDIEDIDSGRWTSIHRSIVQVSHEDWGTIPYFVAFEFEQPLTEYQEGSEGEPGDPYLVIPRSVQTTVWEKVK